jgi:hypothetical protein
VDRIPLAPLAASAADPTHRVPLAASVVDRIPPDLLAASAVGRIPRGLLAASVSADATAQGCCGNRRSIRIQSITEQTENPNSEGA